MSVDTAGLKGKESMEEEKAKILGETAQIPWKDLQPWFAKGAVVNVSPELNLVDVAYALSIDDKERFERWTDENTVGAVTDAQALEWFDSNASLWAVVVRPWILVQVPAVE
ncbi:MAG: hypothetical protein CSB48_10945 [Proteobacteria bacterium]|nr:MAG: hypothetical protein CSB48_10945 [Pseudomonadota bacterium]PIE40056.1 MAG: hypothetical protein CSA51_02710 [Gammaproteobacteria bacterium]